MAEPLESWAQTGWWTRYLARNAKERRCQDADHRRQC